MKNKKFPNVRCETCGLVFSTKPIRLRYRGKDWRKCQNKCNLQPFKKSDNAIFLESN